MTDERGERRELSARQLHVLVRLGNGGTFDPDGKDDLGGRLEVSPWVFERVNRRTVDALLNNGFITLDGIMGYAITKAGLNYLKQRASP